MKYIISIAASIMIFASCAQKIDILTASRPEEHFTEHIMTKSSSTLAYYWHNDEKIYLSYLNDTYFAILKQEGTQDLMSSFSSRNADFQVKEYDTQHLAKTRELNTFISAKITGDIASKYAEDIVYIAPYLNGPSGPVGISDRFYIKLKTPDDINLLRDFAQENGAEIILENFVPLWNTLVCGESSLGNALELANKAYESGHFEMTDIEFIDDIDWNDSSLYNDTYFSTYQWNLHGTYGLNIERVHSITTGIPTVKVAVVDSGIQLNHPDLIITESWDAISETSPGRLYSDNNGIHSHGTSMAGIIGATPNNSIGIVGIAPNVTLLPISTGAAGSKDYITAAIYHAVESNARVISNSYGFGNPTGIVEDAYRHAINNGCILTQSAGNDNNTNNKYPYASIPEVIVVGNITKDGLRHVDDTDPSKGSTYGNHIDVVAPGTRIATLNATSQYVLSTGTSAACPHVAATAALMLSVNPYLTCQQVTDIIERTARKLPNYIFYETADRPNGTANYEVGYGLINCLDAVTMAHYYKENSYTDLIEFDYSGSNMEMRLKTTSDIAVIWDWESKDISFIHADNNSVVDTTLTRGYMSGSRHIRIAELVPPGESADNSSTALIELDLVTGNHASAIDVKSINSDLEYLRIIGGANFSGGSIYISNLPSLEELYLINLKNSYLTVNDCPTLKYFGTSKGIWIPGEGLVTMSIPTDETVSPFVVGGGTTISPTEWPSVPETTMSPKQLNISNCSAITALSLENVDFNIFSFSGLNNLAYVYLSSQDSRIVGIGNSSTSLINKGIYLSGAIATLPGKSSTQSMGKIVIRAINSTNTAYIPVRITSNNRNTIQNNCINKRWDIVWSSGIE